MAGWPSLVEIRRHPVKGLGAEILAAARLEPGRALAGDRVYAMAHAQAGPEIEAGQWASCRNFVRPTTDPRLAQVRVVYDPETRWLIARHPDLAQAVCDLSTAEGRAALADWARPLPAAARAELRVVAADPGKAGPAGHFADDERPALSIHSLASLAALGALAGAPLDRHRFRANLWLDGLEPWAELDLVGRRLRIGAAELEVIDRIERCASPGTDPVSGARDLAVTELLWTALGHRDFGVLARVVVGGAIAPGDAVLWR